MQKSIVIPAQIRAGRALLDWSLDELANAAGVALASVRDLESHKCAADIGTKAAVLRTLENAGIEFLPGTAQNGPGVRLLGSRPNLVQKPTTITYPVDIRFTIEWQGTIVRVLLAFEVIEDLGGHKGKEDDPAYLKTFDKFCGKILDAVGAALADRKNFDQDEPLIVKSEHFPELS